MLKSELKAIMKENLEKAKFLLLRDGYVAPVAFICSGYQIGILPLNFKDQKEKEIQIFILKKIVEESKAEAVIMITESWVVSTNKDDMTKIIKEPIIPSKHPKREECIFVTGECEEGVITIMQKFKKKGKKIIFGKDEEMQDPKYNKFNFGIRNIRNKKFDDPAYA